MQSTGDGQVAPILSGRLYYAGVGSRSTPDQVLRLMTKLAVRLAARGWVLRSGAAEGADSAFQAGIVTADGAEIYVPWSGFNRTADGILVRGTSWSAAERIASELHPAWRNLGQGPRKLHTRNVFQVLGAGLTTPVRFVVCWTEDGCESEASASSKTGGTRTAIVLADRHNIPVINLRNPNGVARVTDLVHASERTDTAHEGD